MENQVQKWNLHGLKCIAMHSSTENFAHINLEDYDIIFTSPEYALTHLRKRLSKKVRQQISLVAFDEAHCLTEWGNSSFRPDYAHMAELLSLLPDASVLIMTGTMSNKMREDTMNVLCISNYETVAISPDRPEIFIEYEKAEFESMRWLVNDVKNKGEQCDKTIIYCRTIRQVTELYWNFVEQLGKQIYAQEDATDSNNRLVDMFSSALSDSNKTRVLQQFIKETKLRVVIATIAFGMGIDIPNIRNVLVWGIPESVCHYWQQIGRSCRDGQRGRAILYPAFVPNSLTSSREIKDIFKSETDCSRLELMKYLWLPEMGNLPNVPDACTDKCKDCSCRRCQCCSVCRQSCPCRASSSANN